MAIKFLNSIESITLPGTTTDYYIGGSGGGVASNALKIGSRTTNNTIAMELFHALNPVSLGISYSGGDALAFIDSVHSSFDSVLQFKTGGDERFRVGALNANTFQIKPASAGNDVSITDNSGNAILYSDTSTQRIGIGTTSPQSKLHLSTGSGGTYSPNANHDDVTIEGNGNIGLQLFSPATSYQYIAFGDPDSVNAGYLRYYHGANEMVFRTNGGDRMVITSSGNVGIGTTTPNYNLDIENASSGAGIRLKRADTGDSLVLLEGTSYGYLQNTTGPLGLGGANGDRDVLIDNNGNVGIGTTTPNQKLHVDGNLRVTGAYYDSNNAPGTLDQVLTSTATGVAWVDPSTITAEAATLVVIECKNTSGATITKGTPVYQTGTVGATDVIEIAPADALISSGSQPAIGLLQTTLNNNGFGKVVITGEFLNFTTDPIDGVTPTTGDKVFLKSGGGLTLTKPTGEGNGIQNLGLIGKVSGGNAGSITVSSIMRTNDVPNLPEGRIWVGDGNTIVSDTVYLDETNERMGIGTTSPLGKLQVNEYTVASQGNQNVHGELSVFANSGDESLFLGVRNAAYPNRGWAFNPVVSGVNSDLQIKEHGSTGVRMTLKSGGNVGIGTTSPSQRTVISGPSTNPLLNTTVPSSATLLLSNSDTAYGTYFCSLGTGTGLIQQRRQTSAVYYDLAINPYGGNVGIGTTSPGSGYAYDIKLDIVAPQLGGIPLRLVRDSSIVNYGAMIALAAKNSASEIITYGAITGGIIDSTDGSEDGYFSIRTIKAGVEAEKVRVDENGNVGIGTTSPNAKLDVVSNTTYDGIQISGSSIPTFGITDTTNNAKFVAYVRDSDATIGTETNHPLTINTNNTERVRITSAGDTGIGVTVPRAKLDVAGGIKVADDTDTAGANKVGTLRYRTSGNNSYVDMCMQTGATTYAWINVVQNNW